MRDLKQLRVEIDRVDQQLLELLGERIQIVSEVGEYKKQAGLLVRDPQREAEKLASLKVAASEKGISESAVDKMWQTLFEISYKVEGDLS